MRRLSRRLLSVSETAQLLGVSERTVYRLAASGRIPCYRVIRQIRIDPDEMAEALQRTDTRRCAA